MKHIIPAVASTNAVIAGTFIAVIKVYNVQSFIYLFVLAVCATEAFKLATRYNYIYPIFYVMVVAIHNSGSSKNTAAVVVMISVVELKMLNLINGQSFRYVYY